MPSKSFLHERDDFKALVETVADNEKINDPALLEKDYWIMHCLYGLQQLGFSFQLKGGTSLSKGHQIISRFSEDIDILIEPPAGRDVKVGVGTVLGGDPQDLKYKGEPTTVEIGDGTVIREYTRFSF